MYAVDRLERAALTGRVAMRACPTRRIDSPGRSKTRLHYKAMQRWPWMDRNYCSSVGTAGCVERDPVEESESKEEQRMVAHIRLQGGMLTSAGNRIHHHCLSTGYCEAKPAMKIRPIDPCGFSGAE